MWAPLFHYHRGTTCSVKILQKFKIPAERGSICQVPLCNLLFLKFWGMPRTVFLDTKLEFGLLGIKRHDLKDKIFLCVLKSGCIESHCLLVLVFPQEFPQQHSGCSVGEPSSAFWGSHGTTSEEDYSYTYELLISPPGNSENRRCVYYQAS